MSKTIAAPICNGRGNTGVPIQITFFKDPETNKPSVGCDYAVLYEFSESELESVRASSFILCTNARFLDGRISRMRKTIRKGATYQEIEKEFGCTHHYRT